MVAERRIAFVPLRYGPEVVGGSEAVMREAAQGFAARGWRVEVLTTCATSHYTWENVHPPGTTTDGELTVTRFPTVVDGPVWARAVLEERIAFGPPLSADEELTWLESGFRAPELFHHLLAHGGDHDAIVFAPYLFWPTVACATLWPDRTVIMPCLHDEPYARLGLFRRVLPAATLAWYLSEPEQRLAQHLGLAPARHVLTGAGIHPPPAHDPAAGRARVGTDRPFVLYAGRREGAKGWDRLVDGFTRAVEHGVAFDLVTTGVGDITVPRALRGRVHDLGFLATEELPHVFAAASALLQPSRMESFSRVIMEAWLAGTPVLVDGHGEVVAWHVRRSGAGLVWHDLDELVAGLELLATRPDLARRMAAAGRDYVLREYTWDAVLDRMEASLEGLPCAG